MEYSMIRCLAYAFKAIFKTRAALIADKFQSLSGTSDYSFCYFHKNKENDKNYYNSD